MCFYVKKKMDFVLYELHSAEETQIPGTVMAGIHLIVNISSCCCLLLYPWMITYKVIFACKLLLEDGKKTKLERPNECNKIPKNLAEQKEVQTQKNKYKINRLI